MTIQERTKAIKAIILARVSSKDQEEGYSLEVQTDRLERYCQRKGIQVLQKFTIVESSTQGHRKQFSEVIKFIKQQRRKIALVADKVDRVQRRHKETSILDELIRQDKLELHFNSEGYIIHRESTAHEMMMWGMGVVVAKSTTDLLSENVRKSIKRKIEVHGEWYGPAPLGYLNKRDDKGRGIIVIDPAQGQTVKKIFETYATGAYTLSQIVDKANKWGLRGTRGAKITKSVMHRLVQNPFYYGEMRIKGMLLPHCHKPLISREVFKQCKEVRMGWEKQPFQYRGKEFLFRGLLKCRTTGKVVTANTKTKTYKNGTTDEWTYLRTWDSKDSTKVMWVREDEVIEQLEEVLKKLQIQDPEILKKTMDYLTVINSSKSNDINTEVKALKDEHTKNQTKLDNMIDLVAEGVLSKDDFLRKQEQLKDRQYELTELIASYDKVDDKLSKKLVTLINITQNAYKTFKGSTIAEKRELLNLLFENLFLNGRKLEFDWAFPFDHLAKLTNCPDWRRERDSNPR